MDYRPLHSRPGSVGKFVEYATHADLFSADISDRWFLRGQSVFDWDRPGRGRASCVGWWFPGIWPPLRGALRADCGPEYCVVGRKCFTGARAAVCLLPVRGILVSYELH